MGGVDFKCFEFRPVSGWILTFAGRIRCVLLKNKFQNILSGEKTISLNLNINKYIYICPFFSIKDKADIMDINRDYYDIKA